MWVHDGDLRHYPLRFSPAPWPLSTRRRGAHTFCPRRSPSRLTSSLFTTIWPCQPGRVPRARCCQFCGSPEGSPQTVTPDSSASSAGVCMERVEPL
jgi:hypothetical protein